MCLAYAGIATNYVAARRGMEHPLPLQKSLDRSRVAQSITRPLRLTEIERRFTRKRRIFFRIILTQQKRKHEIRAQQ